MHKKFSLLFAVSSLLLGCDSEYSGIDIQREISQRQNDMNRLSQDCYRGDLRACDDFGQRADQTRARIDGAIGQFREWDAGRRY